MYQQVSGRSGCTQGLGRCDIHSSANLLRKRNKLAFSEDYCMNTLYNPVNRRKMNDISVVVELAEFPKAKSFAVKILQSEATVRC